MDYQLTVVIRFTGKKDLSLQIDSLEICESDTVEVICIGCGTAKEYQEARKAFESSLNAKFEYADGDYTTARHLAIDIAKGEYLFFPSIKFSYNWENILESIIDPVSSATEVIILRAYNRNRIPGWKKSGKAAIIGIESNPENFFQAFGCTFSYSLVAKSLLKRISEKPYYRSSHDNAFIVGIGSEVESSLIVGTRHNGVTKKNLADDSPKQDIVYDVGSISDSVRLLISIRDSILSKQDPDLDDSFYRILSSRIRTYLLQNPGYDYREPVLSILSSDEATTSFLLSGSTPDWLKGSKKCFEFSKMAIKTFVHLKKVKSFETNETKVICQSKADIPKVSMVVPVYNAGEFIEETLNSALAQTFSDFEIICVNDGSADDSLQKLEEAARNDSRITVLSQPNMGQSVARNAGIDAARGEYVYFFDSDDLLDPQLLATCVNAMEKDKLDMIFFDGSTFFESSDLAHDHDSFDNYYIRSIEYGDICTGAQLMNRMNEHHEYRVSPCLYVTRKKLLDTNRIRFIPGIIHEDNAFTFEATSLAKRASHINEVLYKRRVHEASVMTSKKSFVNSYGYFVCANKLLSCRRTAIESDSSITRKLAISLSFSMSKLAQRDLLDAEDGEEGGAYALEDDDFKMFCMLVLDTERPRRKLVNAEQTIEDLKEKLAAEKSKAKELERQIKTSDTVEEKKRKRLFSPFRAK